MKVITVGVGISGLTLAAALAQLAPQHEVEIYEHDASAADRRKGYAIGLKGATGRAVLVLIAVVAWLLWRDRTRQT